MALHSAVLKIEICDWKLSRFTQRDHGSKKEYESRKIGQPGIHRKTITIKNQVSGHNFLNLSLLLSAMSDALGSVLRRSRKWKAKRDAFRRPACAKLQIAKPNQAVGLPLRMSW